MIQKFEKKMEFASLKIHELEFRLFSISETILPNEWNFITNQNSLMIFFDKNPKINA
jgi:hypothetical protein